MSAGRVSVVLLSGGLMSAVALATAARQTEVKVALHYATAKRHGEDYRAASRIAQHHGINLEVASLPAVVVGDVGDLDPGTYSAMLAMGLLYARRVGARELWTGMSHAIRERPDASPKAIADLVRAFHTATGSNVAVTSSDRMTRAQAFAVASDYGLLDLVLEHTHDCHGSARGCRHTWGHGCGSCEGCRQRADGWEQFVTHMEIVQ